MYWAYCPIGAQKGSKKGSKYGPKRGHFRAIFEPSWLSPYSPYWPVPLCTRPIYHRTQRDLSPVQSGTGQPGSGPGTGLRTRYRAQDPVQGSGPGTGPVQGPYTRIQALYRACIHVYRPCTGTGLPALGNDSFPLTNAGRPILGWGRGISPRPRVLGRISSTKYSGLPCSMSRLGSSGPARARARNDLVLAVLGL